MSDPKVNGSNSDQISNINVDDLLSDIKQMADHVEDLIGKEEKKSPSPPQTPSDKPATPPPVTKDQPELDPAQTLAQMDQLACQAAETVQGEIQTAPPEDNPSETSVSQSEILALDSETESPKQIPVDEHTDKLADDEINEALGRITQKQNEKNNKPEDPSDLGQETSIEVIPGFFKFFLRVLLLLDRPFLWLPRPVKDIVGYIGLATFFLAVILWTMVLLTGKK